MTAVEGAIVRPDVPQHFMVLKPVGHRVTAKRNDAVVAQSDDAVWLMEVGKTLYAPVLYFPRDAVRIEMQREDKSTHCPLKGDASYFNIPGDDESAGFAWTYDDPLEFSTAIKGMIAFYGDKVSLEIGR